MLRKILASLGQLRTWLPSSHHVLLALLFFAGLEIAFAFQRWVLVFLFVLFVLITLGVLLVRREESDDFHFTQAILPIGAALGLTALALFLPVSPLLHLYFLLVGMLFYFLLMFGARHAYPTWNWGLTALALFVDVGAILGWHFHLARSLLVTLGLVWVVSWLLSWQAVRRIPGGRAEALLLAPAIAFLLTELAWVLQFTPLHFLIQAGVILIAYYSLFQVIARSFERRLTRGDVIEYTLVGSAAFVILLAFARWI